MAAYKVIKEFMDLKDGNHMYKAGDIYPRDGSGPTEERIAELAGSDNRRKRPLISVVGEPEPQKEAEEPAAEPAGEAAEAEKPNEPEAEKPAGETAADEVEEPAAEAKTAKSKKATATKGKKAEES